ncbi:MULTISPECIES: hypothetical protein [Brevibacterium]|uniref:Uncharacterized protein n=2 Tax=Brevibacterium TaxID=1696 RepID=A0A1H1MC24_BRESA|nr:hypothetical protein [Brevibacterium sandarakinum]SDR84323.1 hypothetical protein SAMN04489751_0608 [Brevibacterium sandarakinum]
MTTDAQQIAEALKDDPFHIDGALEGTLNADLVDQARETAEGLDYDVYVIAVDEHSLDRDVLEQIKVFNGGEGSFIMINGESQLAVDVNFEDNHDLQMQVMDQMSVARDEWNHSSPSTTKLNILLDLYAKPQEYKQEEAVTGQEAPGSEVQTVDGSGSFASMFLGGAVLILALVIAGIWFTRSLRKRREATRAQEQFQLPDRLLNRVDSLQRKSLRETINADTTQLAEQIEDLQTQNLGTEDAEQVERGLDAYQIARRIVDDDSSERIDLAGAMVLLRQAGREIAEVGPGGHKKRSSRSGSRLPESLCTINPLHGEAQARTRVGANSTNVRVPVCGSCLQDLRADNQLQWIFDGDRPYVEGTSVWAQTLFGAIGSDLVTALHRQGR